MTHSSLGQLDPDPNPLGITWHWQPGDAVDRDATYEPVAGTGIAWLYSATGVYSGIDEETREPRRDAPDFDTAEFMAVPIDSAPSAGWSLMSVADVERVVFQQIITPQRGVGSSAKRGPDVRCVTRLVSVDKDVRRSA